LEQKLFAKLGRTVYHVLRRSIERPEIAQKMVAVVSNDMEKTVAANITSITAHFHDSERALLFCWSHDECNHMAKILGWKPYHVSIPFEERAKFMNMWKHGEVRGLACTCTVMLDCWPDYPAVRIVFHLGQPRDAIDYYQAIDHIAHDGERGQSVVYYNPYQLKKVAGDDPYGGGVIYDMLRDKSLCRRLRPTNFLGGFAVPCTMLPNAQLCDVCEAEVTQVPPSGGPLCFPRHLLPAFSRDAHSTGILVPTSPITQTTMRCLVQPLKPAPMNPMNHPAPQATFGNHFAAAQAALKQVSLSNSEDHGLQVLLACKALTKSCVYCWAHGMEYHSHCLVDCVFNRANEVHRDWQTWSKSLQLPAGCCFFCGCPLQACLLGVSETWLSDIGDMQMKYKSESNLDLQVHNHTTDQACHWISIFKPLSFIIFRDAQLVQHIVYGVPHHPPIRFDANDFHAYARWLCEVRVDGMLNLIHVFLLVCKLQGTPQMPSLPLE
jgi:hypothetical protein